MRLNIFQNILTKFIFCILKYKSSITYFNFIQVFINLFLKDFVDYFVAGKTCWKEVPNKTAKGFISSSLRDPYKCLLYCIAIDVCEALVYDPNSNTPCWFQEGLSGSTNEEDLIPMEGSIVYLLDRSCVLPEGITIGQIGPTVVNGTAKSDENLIKPSLGL